MLKTNQNKYGMTDPGPLHYWIMVLGVAYPLAWTANQILGRPLGGYLFGLVLLGMQWVLVKILQKKVDWTLLLAANIGLIAAFDAFLLVENQWRDPAVLVFLLPLLLIVVTLLTLAIVWLPVGVFRITEFFGAGKGVEQARRLNWRGWLKGQSRRFGLLYGIYLLGSVMGILLAMLVSALFADALQAAGVYPAPLLLRAGTGMLTGLYTWGVLMWGWRGSMRGSGSTAQDAGA